MAEIYFIGGMFVLIMIICTAAVFFFVKTYRKEQLEKLKMENGKRKTEGKSTQEL